MSDTFSVNDRAERVMGLRPTNVVPIDQPCELGYWCPVCRVVPLEDGNFDERLHWSEYEGFLWCSVCNRDYPSVLCVRLDGEPSQPWEQVGVEAAVGVFLGTVESAIRNAKDTE